MTFWSEPGFFKRGRTIADLSWVGNVPVDIEALTRAQITGAKAGSRSRRRLVGIGSRLQDDFEAFLIMRVISSGVVGSKECNLREAGLSNVWTGGQCISSMELSSTDSSLRILEILVMKNSLKDSAKLRASECSGRVVDFPRPSNLSHNLEQFLLIAFTVIYLFNEIRFLCLDNQIRHMLTTLFIALSQTN